MFIKCTAYALFMKCVQCGNGAEKGDICDRCLCKNIEKRIRKYARLNKVFSRGDKLIVVGDICNYFVKSIIKGMPVEVKKVAKRPVKIASGWKLIVQDTIDDECCSFLDGLFGKMSKKCDKNVIKLLCVVTDGEIERFAKTKKLKFKPNKKNELIKKELDKLEEKYRETKYSLVKGCDLNE